MEVSIFLAKLFGLYMLIVAILLTIRQDLMQKVSETILSNTGLLMFSGALNLLGGLSVLIGNPVWGLEWPCVITILGLLMIVKGIMRIGFPEVVARIATSILQNKNALTTILLITALLGLYLTVQGFST